MKWILVLTLAACWQANAAGFAPNTAIRPKAGHTANSDIHGRVIDENGQPLPHVTVTVKATSKTTITGSKGSFTIQADDGQTLLFLAAGYEDREVLVGSDKTPTIQLELSLASLLNTKIVNKGYYTTTQKLNTGNVSTIKAAEIAEQPVANPLAALVGRAPGVIVTQSNGLPGAGFSVQIRGQNSILNGNDPLFLID
ncbi:MAG TPA: carboxypeptidase-like regulatory domain-containing protein, partial [Puia sp.]|nr:carboxypeptidase-like regulatory domain-containing protein [Puia sp.]